MAPFSTYPRFIACDRQQHIYTVRADLQNGRAHRVDQIDNIAVGVVLPDDQSFMLLRGSPHERQTAERCFLTFMTEPSLQRRSCGKLYDKVDIETDGFAVVADDVGSAPSFVTLKPSGLLGRKLL